MTNEENQKFTKLHKFLFTDETFKFMKAKSKLLYAILTERQSLTIAYAKNNRDQSQFLDENNRLFSIYSNSDLEGMLHVSEPTIINLKKELIEYGLLEEIRVPTSNNRLYPKKPYDEYYYLNDIDEFYRLPYALFDNPFYKKLSPDAIISYAIYLSRYEYSVFKDSFYDNTHNIYCVMPNQELANILSINRKKVARLKNELIAYGLIEVKPSKRADKLYVNPPKHRNDSKLKKWDVANLKNGTLQTKDMGRCKLKKWDTSNTDLSNTDLSNTELSNTTTKKENDFKQASYQVENISGGGEISKETLFNTIQQELNILLTPKYKQNLEMLTKNFTSEVIAYAIEYAATNGNNPKQYLLKILENWKQAQINTLDQAKSYTHIKTNKAQNVNVSREMTPQWLENRKSVETNETQSPEDEAALKRDREALLERLNNKK